MKLKFFICCLLIVASSITWAQEASTATLEKTKSDSILAEFHDHPKHILVAAHRAAHQNHPENSLAAIQESIDLGIDIIEFDIRQTQDGELVVMHDETIDRTTNGKGEVDDLKFSELQELNLKFENQLTTEKIPTFEEVLKLTKNKILLDIDFKIQDVGAVMKTYALIKEYNMEDQVLFYLYEYRYASKLQELDASVKIMPRAYNRCDVEEILKLKDIKAVHVDESFYTPELMKAMMDSGARVWINALGKYDSMETELKGSGFKELLEKKYINIIQTDLPEQLLAFLRESNLHR